jgi:HK97 family phage major capsid protein/HK97 family phage prohead protease
VPLSFSSESEVERWFGIEILDHAASSVRLGRLRNGGAFLMDHNTRDQIGVVESVEIGNDRRGRAVVRFGRSARAEEIFQDVVDGIRRLVSVGYRVHRTETTTRTGGVEVVRVTDWEPFEISLVSIPADDSVGVGRSETVPAGNQPNFSNLPKMDRDQLIALLRSRGIAFDESATTDQLRGLLGSGQPPAPTPTPGQRSQDPAPVPHVQVVREAPPSVTPEAAATRAVELERTRVSGINILADQMRSNGVQVDSARAIAEGTSVDAFREVAFSAMIAQRNTPYQPGLPGPLSRGEQRDLSRFSMGRGIQLIAAGRQLDGVEREMHDEAHHEARQFGIGLSGQFSVPMVALTSGQRDLTATGGSNGDQGGNTIVTTHGAFIDMLYNRLVFRKLGAQFLTNLQGNFALPKLLTGSAPAKATENAALGESSPTTGLVNFSPKRAGRFVEYSKQLIAQSPLAWEGILRNDLSTALALLMEVAAINGGGSDEPTGILGTSGIGSVAGGTNGLALTRSNAIKLKTAVATANGDVGSLGWLTNAAVRGKAQETAIDAGSGQFLWKEDRDDWFMGYNAGVTNSVPGNLVKGTSGSTCSAAIFGNFADAVFAMWGGIDFTVNPYIKDTEGLIRITADCFYDFGVRRAASFAAIKDLLTA